MERVELHLTTKMTEMESVIDTKDLIEKVHKLGMKAVAITDYKAVQAFPEVYKYLKKIGYDIKPIYGAEIRIKDSKNAYQYGAVILATNQTGLKNLYKIVSEANIQNTKTCPILKKSFIEKHRKGLLVGCSCHFGELYENIEDGKTDKELEEIAKFYDYFEIQPATFKGDEELNEKIIEIAEKENKMVVAVSNAYYLEKEDRDAYLVLSCYEGYDTEEQLHFRTTEELLGEFEYLDKEKVYEYVVTNTNKIAGMCEDIKLLPDGKCYPKIDGSKEEIEKLSYEKAKFLYGEKLPIEVESRLKEELDIITSSEEYSTIYMIAQKLVKKSNQYGYRVDSRGCIGSSLVAYLIGITDINPLVPHYRCDTCKYTEFSDSKARTGVDLPDKVCPKCGKKLEKDGMNILHQTLFGKAGEKEPDIDLNFSKLCIRDLQKNLKEIFGNNKVFKAGTTSLMRKISAIRRICEYYKNIGEELSEDKKNELLKNISGVKRCEGVYSAGMIIIPKGYSVYDFTPVQYNCKGASFKSTHYDYHVLSDTLLKFDMLIHDIPTILKKLQEVTGIDPKDIPLDDKKVMSIFTSLDVLGITKKQLGYSAPLAGIIEFNLRFIQDMLEIVKPTTFEELVRIIALSHGTDAWNDNAYNLITKENININDIISSRDDVMQYLIEKGISKDVSYDIMVTVFKGKAIDSNEDWKEYVKIMQEHNVPNWYIESCQKICYLFPRAHAVSYVSNAFRLAWYKVYYTKEFFEIVSQENDDEDLKKERNLLGIKID